MYFLNILKYFKKHIINITIQLIKTYNKKVWHTRNILLI
jgi:hypothetical protein